MDKSRAISKEASWVFTKIKLFWALHSRYEFTSHSVCHSVWCWMNCMPWMAAWFPLHSKQPRTTIWPPVCGEFAYHQRINLFFYLKLSTGVPYTFSMTCIFHTKIRNQPSTESLLHFSNFECWNILSSFFKLHKYFDWSA